MEQFSTPKFIGRIGLAVAATLAATFVAQPSRAQDDLPEGADPALHAKVPEEYRDGLVTVYDPQYPPSYYVDENGEMAGYVIDFHKAVATKLGIPVKAEAAKFAGIISGILGGRYDMSYFHDTVERREKMDIVDFQRTGTNVMVKAGNPADIDLHELCGHKIGVTSGGQQGLELLPRLQAECAERGEPKIEALNFPGPNEGSLAVKTGRIDGWLGDAPYTGYIIKQSNGIFDKTPTADLTGVSGFAFRKGDPMAELVKEAAAALIADGTYEQILADWNITQLALDAPLMNGE